MATLTPSGRTMNITLPTSASIALCSNLATLRALFLSFFTLTGCRSLASYLPVVQPGGHLQEYPLSHSSWWDLTLSELNCCIIYLVCRSRKQLAAEISSDCSQPGGTWEDKALPNLSPMEWLMSPTWLMGTSALRIVFNNIKQLHGTLWMKHAYWHN